METVWVPENAALPLHAPDAVQEVALVEDQVKVALPPEVTEDTDVVRVTVGGTTGTVTVIVTDWLTLPPAPVHVMV